jgi:omega-6 fatty acid desaturase (delta-12 desaturase)
MRSLRTFYFDLIFVACYRVTLIVVVSALSVRYSPDWSLFAAVGYSFLLGFVVPYYVWSSIFGVIVFLHHTHPQSCWYSSKKDWDFYSAMLECTIHVEPPWPLNHLFLRIMDHNAHHVDPSIAYYRLPPEQVALESAYPQSVVVEKFSFSYLRRIARTCQLYDYENHCWLDFNGKRTTQPRRIAIRKHDCGASTTSGNC